jgi:hypothetical protein
MARSGDEIMGAWQELRDCLMIIELPCLLRDCLMIIELPCLLRGLKCVFLLVVVVFCVVSWAI